MKTVLGLLIFFIVFAFLSWFINKRKENSNNFILQRKKRKKQYDSRAQTIPVKRNPLVEYPSYDLSAAPKPQLRACAAGEKSKTRPALATYTYNDLKSVIEKKDAEFFKRAAAAKTQAFAAKKQIYQKRITNAEYILRNKEYDPTSRQNEFSEAIDKQKRLIARCELIIHTIDRTDCSPQQLFADYRQMLWDSAYGLESMVGCGAAKNAIAQRIFAFINDPSVSYTGFQNRMIKGVSGIGKTTLSKCLSKANALSGLTVMGRDNDPRQLSQSDFESRWVGGTSPKVNELMIESLEEVANGDELYALAQSNGIASYGMQAINAIVAEASEYEGLSHLYAIGYPEEMDVDFLAKNQGLQRRFPTRLRIDLEPYTPKELSTILIRFLIKNGQFDIGDRCAITLYTAVDMLYKSYPELFRLQASSMVDIGTHIIETIKSAKNVTWEKGQDTKNAQLLLDCFNDYLTRQHGIRLNAT